MHARRWWVLSLILALPGALVVAARISGGHPPTPWPQLTAFVLPALPVAGSALLLALLTRRRILIALTAAPVALLAFWAAPPIAPDRPATCTRATDRLTVMTLNTYFGDADTDSVLSAVRDQDVSVLAAQEATPEFVVRLEAAGLRGYLPYEHVLARPTAAGTALWSRYPLAAPRELDGLEFAAPTATMDVRGTTVSVAAVHPASPWPGHEGTWQHDLDALTAGLVTLPEPKLIMGDFNASRDHAAFRRLLGVADVADAADIADDASWPGATWPANGPVPAFTRLDHVLISDGLRADAVRTVRIPGTDHRAVLADLEVCS